MPDLLLRKLESQQSGTDAEFSFSELGEVITFLGRFNLIALQKQLEKLDQNKLMYVFQILKSDLVSDKGEQYVNLTKLYILLQIMRYKQQSNK